MLTARPVRSYTCRIIGLPAMSARTLPGNRVDSRRAGMTATAFSFMPLLSSHKAQDTNLLYPLFYPPSFSPGPRMMTFR